MSHLILRNTDDVENIQHKHTPKPKGFSSWKKYWCDQSDEDWPETCRFRGCGDNADGCAHVIVNDDEDSEYLIPMCNDHNSPGFSEIFNVNSGTFAVYIDREEIVSELVANLTDYNQPIVQWSSLVPRRFGWLRCRGKTRVEIAASNSKRLVTRLAPTLKNHHAAAQAGSHSLIFSSLSFGELSLKSGIRVQNISGTHACLPRGYGSWKKFYMDDGEREWPNTCRISGCLDPAKGGAHVHLEGKPDCPCVYIVPMCEQHNTAQNKDWLPVKKGTVIVRVDQGDTSGPPGTCYSKKCH